MALTPTPDGYLTELADLLAGDPFASPAELSAYTEGSITIADPRAPLILAGATRAIQRYAGWHIAPSLTETKRLDGAYVGNILQLPSLHVTEVTSVIAHNRRDASTITYDEYSFGWSENGNVEYYSKWGWPYGYRNIEIEFTHGYSLDQISDLKQIVLQVSAQALSSPTGATREQAGQVSMQWATTAPGVSGGLSLLARDLEVVNSYKLPARV